MHDVKRTTLKIRRLRREYARPSTPTVSPTKTQDCARCSYARRCWDAKADDRVIEINLLVCRLQANIDQRRTVRRLLELVRPKIAKLAGMVAKQSRGRTSPQQAIEELERETILHLQLKYDLTAMAYPLYYLFGPSGQIQFAARSMNRNRAKRALDRQWLAIADNNLDSHDDQSVMLGSATKAVTLAAEERDLDEEIDEAQRAVDAHTAIQRSYNALTAKEFRFLCLWRAHLRWRDKISPRSLGKAIGLSATASDATLASIATKLADAGGLAALMSRDEEVL